MVRRLRDLQKHLDIDDMDVGQWTPSAAWLKRLCFRLQFDSSEVAAADFLDDIDENCTDALADPIPLPAEPTTLVAAMQELRTALYERAAQRCSAERLQRAQRVFNAFLNAELQQHEAPHAGHGSRHTPGQQLKITVFFSLRRAQQGSG